MPILLNDTSSITMQFSISQSFFVLKFEIQKVTFNFPMHKKAEFMITIYTPDRQWRSCTLTCIKRNIPVQ